MFGIFGRKDKKKPQSASDDKVVCRYCGQKVKKGDRHQCSQMREQKKSPRIADDDDGDFFISLLVAEATDDWLLGYMVGGDLTGAIVGDILADGDEDGDRYHSEPAYEPEPEPTPSRRSGGFDIGRSDDDRGSSGGFGGGSSSGGGGGGGYDSGSSDSGGDSGGGDD